MMTDSNLLREFAGSQSEAAFQELVRRYGKLVHACARQRVGDPHAAEDIAQSVFLALAVKARQLPAHTALEGWLYRATRFAASRHQRAERNRRDRERKAHLEQELQRSDDEANALREELVAHLATALDGLSSADRKALLLRFYRDASYREMGEMLLVSEEAAKKRVNRALERLRRLFAKRGVTVKSVDVLMALLSAEAGAAVLPATFVSATVQAAGLAATGKLAAGVGTGAVSAQVAALTKGVLNMLFWNSVKTALVAVVVSLVVVGSGAMVAQEALQGRGAEPPAPVQPAAPATTAIVPFSPLGFVRLKYDGLGWDGGMAMETSRADRDLLKRILDKTGLALDCLAESHDLARLAKYPTSDAPPFVYMTGSGTIEMAESDMKILRNYLNEGGMLFADCGSPQWDASFREFIKRLLPDRPLQAIADDDILFQTPFVFTNGAPALWSHGSAVALGVKSADRWSVFYHPGDLQSAWRKGQSGMSPAASERAVEMVVNLIHYAHARKYLADASILRIPFLAKAPTVDGAIGAGEWDSAAAISGFFESGAHGTFAGLVSRAAQPRVCLGYDHTNLYMCYRIPIRPAGYRLRHKGMFRDTLTHPLYGLGSDDCVQFELWPSASAKEAVKRGFFRLDWNAIGTLADWHYGVVSGADFKWDPKATLRSVADERFWVSECAIPLRSLRYGEYDQTNADGVPLVNLPPADGTTYRVWFASKMGEMFRALDAHDGLLPGTKMIFDTHAPLTRVDELSMDGGQLDAKLTFKNRGADRETIQVGFVYSARGTAEAQAFWMPVHCNYIAPGLPDGTLQLAPGEERSLHLERFPDKLNQAATPCWIEIRGGGTPDRVLLRLRLK